MTTLTGHDHIAALERAPAAWSIGPAIEAWGRDWRRLSDDAVCWSPATAAAPPTPSTSRGAGGALPHERRASAPSPAHRHLQLTAIVNTTAREGLRPQVAHTDARGRLMLIRLGRSANSYGGAEGRSGGLETWRSPAPPNPLAATVDEPLCAKPSSAGAGVHLVACI